MKNKQLSIFVSASLMLMFAVIFSQTAEAAIYSSLTVGSRGAQVTELQQTLTNLGFYNGPITGYFGGLTRAAVVKFQKANNINPAVGYFGSLSRAKLSQLAQGKPTTQPSAPLPPVSIKKLPTLPKAVKSSVSVNDVGTVTPKPKISFLERFFPVAHAFGTSRVFLYKSGSFPSQLFYYDLTTGEQRQLTSEGKEIYSASILDQVNSVVYATKNTNFGVTLKVLSLDNPSISKIISTTALGPINFSLGPDGRNFAYIDGGADGLTNYLVVKDLGTSDMPTIVKRPLPAGVTNVAELAWSPSGTTIYLLKRPNVSGGPEAIIEFYLKDQAGESFNEVVSADSYKSLLSMPFADGRLFYLSLANQTNPSGILVVEKNTNSGSIYNHTETLGATNYLVAPDVKKIYFHAAVNNDDPILASYNIVGFGQSSQEIIVSGSPQCNSGNCAQKFYSYNVSTKEVRELFTSQFSMDTSGPSDISKPNNPPVPSPITPVAPPVVLYPNGGEVLSWGQATSISWTPNSYTGYFDIFVRGIGSGNLYTVSQNVPAQAADRMSASWTPTQGNYEKDTQFVAKVCKSGTQICDESNSSFSIPNSYSKPIILYPNNGEVLQGGITQYISWTPQNNSGSFDVSIVGVYSGNSYSIAQNVPYVAADKISTSWIPTTGSYEKDTLFKARVCITGTTICGESNNFSIQF